MSYCIDSEGNSRCGFQYAGLPCPLDSPAKQPKLPYPFSFRESLFDSLTLTDRPAARDTVRRAPPPNCPFLALPGEIRNRIYHFALVTAKPFAVQLQWNRPLDAALLQVNKQIFDEASGIFYAENTFRFPEALFVGAPILHQLRTLYHVSGQRLRMMRSVALDVPVYGSPSNSHLRRQTCVNLRRITDSLAFGPETKVQLQFGFVWGENCRYQGPSEYWDTLATGIHTLRLNRVDFEVHIRTHPRFMDAWVDLLTQEFQDKWSLEAIFQLYTVMQNRLTFEALNRFSDRYQLPGLKEFYEETWSMSSYIFKPRRVPSSGACAERIA